MRNMKPRPPHRSRRYGFAHGCTGNTILEFALCLTVLAPAMLGMFTVGMNLTRNLQAMQVARDAGHMYVRYVDFSAEPKQKVLARLARDLKMIQDGTLDTPDKNGQAVIILTTIYVPTAIECTAAGLQISQCVNIDIPVIMNRVVVGNDKLRESVYGTPHNKYLKSKGNIDKQEALTKSDLRAQNIATLPPLTGGQDAFVAEVYAASPDYDLAMSGSGVYARAIF